ncbi:MAG: hypothetical protein K2O06_02105 [Acetatifactor sp.]|jgi:hypothetical protein|nr:hypothetical protein [uncultured Acetatifactor sp.]MDE7351835.1 hypothetical protein [Acetatifactor sp.]
MEKCKTKGELFVEALLRGDFKKNYRPNHGEKITDGLENMYQYNFEKYLSSCGCFLMDLRFIKEDYHG